MVVALCAPLARTGQDRNQLAEALGIDPDEAWTLVSQLLSDPHPLVASGAGVWVRTEMETAQIRQWWERLPNEVDTGDLPTQEELDRWAEARTLGLIRHFPMKLTPEVVCLLASALATKVSWEAPFEVVDAEALQPSSWPTTLRRALRSPEGSPWHHEYLAEADSCGLVAVHLATASDGLLVGSVIAADPAVPAGDVLAAAEEIVTSEATQAASVARRSLFDLPLGDGPLWSISEEEVRTTEPDGREERVVSVLPAWSAETELDLTDDEALGFPVAARAVAGALGLRNFLYEAKQTAMARYHAVGFEAAAITHLAIATSAKVPRPGKRRTALVRFAHPFAVVAAAFDDPRDSGQAAPSVWHGLPVFSAWVTNPTDAEAPNRGDPIPA